MTFIDNVIELILVSIFGGIITAIVFGGIFLYGGLMLHDKNDYSKFPIYFSVTIFVLFIIANIILFIVNVNHLFFN